MIRQSPGHELALPPPSAPSCARCPWQWHDMAKIISSFVSRRREVENKLRDTLAEPCKLTILFALWVGGQLDWLSRWRGRMPLKLTSGSGELPTFIQSHEHCIAARRVAAVVGFVCLFIPLRFCLTEAICQLIISLCPGPRKVLLIENVFYVRSPFKQDTQDKKPNFRVSHRRPQASACLHCHSLSGALIKPHCALSAASLLFAVIDGKKSQEVGFLLESGTLNALELNKKKSKWLKIKKFQKYLYWSKIVLKLFSFLNCINIFIMFSINYFCFYIL